MPPAAPRAVGMSRALTPVARPRTGSYEKKALSGHTMRRSKSGIAVGNSLSKMQPSICTRRKVIASSTASRRFG